MTNLISYTKKVIIAFILAVLLTACGGGSSGGDSNNLSTITPDGGSGSTSTTGSATLSWTPPTQNTDGSQLNDLNGYKIYYGTSQTSLDTSIELTNSGLTEYVIDNLTAGTTYYFAITTLNSSNIESAYSNIASKDITG